MISHRYKCIFVAVPKTGCTSIMSILGRPPRPHLDIWQLKHDLEQHWTYYRGPHDRLLQALYLLLPAPRREAIGRGLFDSYFKFGFVRNPWERAVSLYERGEGIQMHDRMSFEEFIDWMQFSSSTCIHPPVHRHQFDWFVDPSGNILVDFIGRFEDLRENWAFVCRRLGIHKPLPHANQNPRRTKHYTEYYTPRTRQIIAERFRVDIEYFGYQFGDCPLPLLLPGL